MDMADSRCFFKLIKILETAVKSRAKLKDCIKSLVMPNLNQVLLWRKGQLDLIVNL